MPETTVELELAPIEPGSNPFLNGWRAPLRAEAHSDGTFDVLGTLPPGLEGRMIFLGPNPVRVDDPEAYRPTDGDAMVHLLEFRNGAVTSMASRFVVTRHLVELLGARAPEGPLAAAGPVGSGALVHTGRRLLCVDGRGLGYRITADLRTACIEDFDATLATPMGRHVVADPRDRSARFVGVDRLGPPWLRLHHLDPQGVVATRVIEMPSLLAEPALGVSETHSVLFESSLRSRPLRGEDDVLRPLRFDVEGAVHVGLVGHDESGEQIRWSTSEPGHVLDVAHVADTPLGVRSVVLRSSPEKVGDPSWWPGTSGHLEAIDVNAVGSSASIERLDDLVLDGLVGDPAIPQHQRRFLYGVTADRSGTKGALLVKYDLVTGVAERRAVPEHEVVDTPLFVRDPEGRSDEEGWVVVPIFDRSAEESRLLVLDATRFTGTAEAMVRLPQRLPIGLSGAVHLSPESYR